MNHLGQDRLVELHQSGAGREQLLDLLAKDTDEIVGKRLACVVNPIRNALQPHRPGEQVRAR